MQVEHQPIPIQLLFYENEYFHRIVENATRRFYYKKIYKNFSKPINNIIQIGYVLINGLEE